ncbi:MAG TPA: hypothetical protein VN700_05360 [Vicinamibacterales bacterium]|nr:hypothetical protein [Vicinamibacterales bacterium]
MASVTKAGVDRDNWFTWGVMILSFSNLVVSRWKPGSTAAPALV